LIALTLMGSRHTLQLVISSVDGLEEFFDCLLSIVNQSLGRMN